MVEKIEVVPEKVKIEIDNLKSLLNDIDEDPGVNIDLDGKGYTNDTMELTKNKFNEVKTTLSFLINETIMLLENINNGYVEMDENEARKINEFTREVLKK